MLIQILPDVTSHSPQASHQVPRNRYGNKVKAQLVKERQFLSCFKNIAYNGWAIGYRFGLRQRLKIKPYLIHVLVRTKARVTE
ncbi:hypothetical protein PsB1_1898 [Candidatus Phycosocius spiralis]|uniref:Uncharacterized protein n=1 Tax=Candidatus Phycosocius spiralis TaxID=2815099 RepID=A0ABQ4PXQ7_9PROT|nr:hypothetical protein PsB1_1898 [Candidatus Phycosocius spiralis]